MLVIHAVYLDFAFSSFSRTNQNLVDRVMENKYFVGMVLIDNYHKIFPK